MKTLQAQYNLIKEGKGDKAYFMKLARYNFPDLITPVLSYSDTITVLKNKSILSEGIGGVITTGKKQDWHAIFNENMEKLKEKKDDEDKEDDDDDEKYKEKIDQYEKREKDIEKFGLQHLKHLREDKKEIISQLMGPDFFLSKKEESTWDDVDIDTYNKITKMASSTGKVPKLNEAKEVKAEEKETTKDVTDMATRGYDYKDEKNYDNVFGQEFLQGYYAEMKDPKNEGKHVEELRQIVAKNLAKDINYYVKNGQFGVKGLGYITDAPGLGEPKPAKGKHKASGYGDLKESVLRSQIYLLVKEVLAEGENKDLLKHRLGVLKAALAYAEKEIKNVDKDSKIYKEVEKTIAGKKREIEALEKEILTELQPEPSAEKEQFGDMVAAKLKSNAEALKYFNQNETNITDTFLDHSKPEGGVDDAVAHILKQTKAAPLSEKKKPSAGLTKKEKSAISKKAHAGGDIGEKGKGFEKVAKAAEKQYGSKEAGEKVAAAAMWKSQAAKK